MFAARKQDVVRPFALAVTTAALVLGMSGLALAQSGAQAPVSSPRAATVAGKHSGNGEGREQSKRNEHLQKLTKRLKLTDDQAPKVKSIMEAQWAESRELRAKNEAAAATPEAQAAFEKAREDLRASTDAKLASVLNADQMSEFKKMRAEHMKKHEKDEAKENKK